MWRQSGLQSLCIKMHSLVVLCYTLLPFVLGYVTPTTEVLLENNDTRVLPTKQAGRACVKNRCWIMLVSQSIGYYTSFKDWFEWMYGFKVKTMVEIYSCYIILPLASALMIFRTARVMAEEAVFWMCVESDTVLPIGCAYLSLVWTLGAIAECRWNRAHVPKSKRWKHLAAKRVSESTILNGINSTLTRLDEAVEQRINPSEHEMGESNEACIDKEPNEPGETSDPIDAMDDGNEVQCKGVIDKYADEIAEQQVCERAFCRRRVIRTATHQMIMVWLSIMLSSFATADSFIELGRTGLMGTKQVSPALAMQNVFVAYRSTSELYGADNDHRYDSDSCQIAIDNCSSRCITNEIRDFIDEPRRVSVKVTGVAGSATATYVGTVRWSVRDDKGKTHHWVIPNTFYNSQSPFRLLSPQHWAQERREWRGTGCITYFDAVELFWSHAKFGKMIELDPAMNVALLRSAPGYSHFSSFCAGIHDLKWALDESEFLCMPCVPELVTDDEMSESDTSDVEPTTCRHPDIPDKVFVQPTDNHRAAISDPIDTMHFNLQPERTVHVVTEDEDVQGLSPQAELLVWHYRLGHISFRRILKMVERGDLPKRLLSVTILKCAACLCGKATLRAWRTRAPVNKFRAPPATSPGAVVAVDQLVSSTPGLISQMKGFLTRKRYTVTTVFVDHFSGLSYVHSQMSTDATSTIEAKRAFERYAKSHRVTVRHYHADNGIFSSKAFIDEINQRGQTITFCAVNAHHQNGKAEKRIRDLQESARTMLLHARQRWPEAVTANLWPFAIRYANDMFNAAPSLAKDKEGVSPIELFAQTQVAPRFKHSHTFGSPVYVLDAALQQGQRIGKWNERARIGIYLGSSPRHSRKVALVLNLVTGHVSPQFHCVFDDLCETLRQSSGNPRPLCKWQEKTGFEVVDDSADTNLPVGPDFVRASVEQRIQQQQLPEHQPVEPELADDADDNIPFGEIGQHPEENEPVADEAEPTETRATSANQRYSTIRTVPEYLRETRSGRQPKGIARLALYVSWDVYDDNSSEELEMLEHPISFAASTNPDILYLDDAMRAPDAAEFRKAMVQEIKSHMHCATVAKGL